MDEDNKLIPIGIIPRKVWREQIIDERMTDIESAARRYKKEGLKIPRTWMYEYNKLRNGVIDE